MIALADAQAALLEGVEPLDSVEVRLADALGRVAAAPVRSPVAAPPVDNSAMDGYAVRAADTVGASAGHPVRLEVVADLPAGSAERPHVGEGQAARIMTGAPVPDGADAVVMVEHTHTTDDRRSVAIAHAASVGDHIRRAGEDVAVGDEVVAVGDVMTPARVGVAAGAGATTVTVVRPPRVGVLSTGDEVVEAGTALPLPFGRIFDSNRPSIMASAVAAGAVVVDLGHVDDDPVALAAALGDAAAGVDVIITTGGVSVGDHDHLAEVVGQLGEVTWMQVAIRPAKPLAIGRIGRARVVGLPGNPVSALVSFELFVRPLLRALGGRPPDRLHRPRVDAVLTAPVRRGRDGKTHFVRVTLARISSDDHDQGWWSATPVAGQGSHQLAALAHADGLAVVPDGDGLAAGDEVEVVPLGDGS